MKTSRTLIGLTLLASTIIGLTLGSFWSKNKVAEICQPILQKKYEYQCQSSQLLLFPTPRVLIKDFNFTWGKKDNSVWDVRIGRIKGLISPWAILKWRLILSDVLIEKPDILLTETTPTSKDSPSTSRGKTIPKIEIESLEVDDAKFTYVDRDRKKTRADAKIAFDNISLESRGIVFSDDLIADTRLKLSGRLGPGRINLEIELRAPLKVPDIKVHANIDNTPLSVVNSYTKPSEGLTLNGRLINAISHSHIKGEKVDSSVKIQYSDLDVVINNTEDRTGIEAWLAEAYLDIKICDQKKRNLKTVDYTHSLYHKGEQSWVQFYLMGLLKSALTAACFEDAI